MNWLSQISAVVLYNLRTIPERKGSALTAAVGIAGVVLVLVGVLAIAAGFKRALTSTGSKDVAIVLRSGADNEMNSGLSREDTRLISDAPGLARGATGPLASAELFVVVDLPKRSTGTDANVPLRGVSAASFDVRGNIQIVQGRKFETGKNEIIVGTGAARAFAGLDLSREIQIGANRWQIVGIFTAGGGSVESEIWSDAEVLQPAYNREGFQSVYARLNSPASFMQFKDALTTNPQLKVKVVTLDEFFADQSSQVSNFIIRIGVFIAALMAIGAFFAALNTMYGAVSARTREIATLRALGFSAGPIVTSVLAESIAVALFGGVLGAGAAWLAFDGYQASTINWQTFSQVTFAFAVTPALLVTAIVWSTILGLLGGLFPAIRAARLPIATALRET
jgi:putative ABC transport system permease protein